MFSQLINISRTSKQIILLLIDSLLLVSVLLVSFSIRLGYWYFPESDLVWVILGAPIIAVPIFIRFGLYRSIIRYVGLKTLWSITQAVSLYALIWGIVGFMSAVEGIPRSVILINWTLAMLVIGGLRMAARWLLSDAGGINQSTKNNIAIYGAGDAGRQLLTALQQSSEYNPVAFIDDESGLHKQTINSVSVYAPNDIVSLIDNKQVTEVLIAIPSISRARRSEIIDFLEPHPVMVQSLPGVTELAQGKVNITDLKEVSINDLLGRDSVLPNQDLLEVNIKDKVVMVTGAGGSIGSELCRQIIRLGASRLILFEQSELALYDINKELKDVGDIDILPILGSVVNQDRVERVCKSFSVQTVYHAAAYKHVPMVEFNNTEGVNNNVFGTLSVAQAAINCNVKTFVLISTDKAVRPTNTMGATKRSAELVLQALSALQGATKFTMVRFGNVLGSSGSVIPLFKQQIKDGGPVTVTDVNIIRYFMTIPEAVELVIQAGAMGTGGDVFVLDMGEPVRVDDLAKKMIRLSGLKVKDEAHPEGDIEIKYTGLRPGEKLYEELLIGDNVSKTDNPLIMRAEEDALTWDELKPILDGLELAIDECDHTKLRALLMQAVPGFKPQCEITDVLYNEV